MAIPLADQYMLAASLQQGFIDKDSGQLLAFGYLNFYRDVDRTTRKPIYEIGGPPDAPTYTELPNPLYLSAIGTFQDPDNQQDIIPYYKPYDDDGNIDLYYIEVYSADDVLQFTREHFPSVIDTSGNVTFNSADTLIPNGQFWMHIDQPNDGLIPSADSSIGIAFGGWKFLQTANTSAINYVTFQRYDAPSDTPDQNPRYACEVKCTQADPSDSAKQIYCTIGNVNFMQGQDLTFQFTAYSDDGNNHNVNFLIRKFYGTGGSPETEEIVETVIVTPQIQNFTIPFTMSSNIGKTLGTNDDSINIGIQSPLSTTSDIFFTDIFLVPGTYTTLTYPPIDLSQDKAYTMGSSISIPNYDGSQIGKYVQLGTGSDDEPNGVGYGYGFQYRDPVPTGSIIMSGVNSTSPPDSFLYCGGAQYGIDDRSTIPYYVNLFSQIGYNYGTGVNGFHNETTMSANILAVTWNRFDVLQATPTAGTSGFTFTLVQPAIVGTQPQQYTLTVLAGSSIIPGSYYTQPVNTTGPQFIQAFFFIVDGIGNIPNITYDVIVGINISASDTAQQVRDKVIENANGLFQVPDLRGYFPRFWDNGAGRDPDANIRDASANSYPQFPDLSPSGNAYDNVGSVQSNQNLAHDHSPYYWNAGNVAGPNAPVVAEFTPESPALPEEPRGPSYFGFSMTSDGGSESRPLNIYVNAFIKT